MLVHILFLVLYYAADFVMRGIRDIFIPSVAMASDSSDSELDSDFEEDVLSRKLMGTIGKHVLLITVSCMYDTACMTYS